MPEWRWAKENFAGCFTTHTTPGGPVTIRGATSQVQDLVAPINAISAANTTLVTTSSSTNTQDKQDKLKHMSRG